MTGDRVDAPGGTERAFHRRVTAAAEELVELRHALARWVAEIGMSVEQQEDVVLAGYEAMANSAEHAYRDGAHGALDVRATYHDHELTVTVTDYGTWQPPDPTDGFRGRGLVLIRRLAHDSATTHRDDGTTVTMTWKAESATGA
ncbi:MAG TPA: ATP-binding protein [Pseudonocardia sp.]|jgi:anti-sigma regulatory factor (Ser/Thr protein kinase)